jgi:uncharacterized protein (DUF1499 family)
MESKYKGIDAREIKCCCNNPNCIESGISFDKDYLFFHFLEYDENGSLHQIRKAMMLNKENINQLIQSLKDYKKQFRKDLG